MCVLFSCATAPVTSEKDKKEAVPSQKEQEERSLGLFNEILAITREYDDRETVLLKKEELYRRIVTEYPDVPLAQESYWRLISLYVNDYKPPAYEKAEPLYSEFRGKYPESVFNNFIRETLSKSYYKRTEWDRLLKICTPVFADYTEKGIRPTPLLIYLYAEANYNLGNYDDAEKGYEAVLEVFPKLSNIEEVKARLKEIRKK
jgi:tetratricopeptide (TPR) repeat protein